MSILVAGINNRIKIEKENAIEIKNIERVGNE